MMKIYYQGTGLEMDPIEVMNKTLMMNLATMLNSGFGLQDN
jgi:hypothetical protein